MNIAARRQELADAFLAAALPATIHAAPPTLVAPPAVVIVPEEPYFEPRLLGDALTGDLSLRVAVFASRRAGASELDELEQLATTAMGVLPNGWDVGPLSRPSRVPVDDSEQPAYALSAYFTTTTTASPLET